jgi:hypothetical protein
MSPVNQQPHTRTHRDVLPTTVVAVRYVVPWAWLHTKCIPPIRLKPQVCMPMCPCLNSPVRLQATRLLLLLQNLSRPCCSLQKMPLPNFPPKPNTATNTPPCHSHKKATQGRAFTRGS